MNTIWQDISYGVRVLVRDRTITLVAVIALALGIGANTAIFSVVNALLFRGLPYKDADRLVMLWETNPQIQVGFDLLPVSVGAFDDWQKRSESFEHVSVLESVRYAVVGAGRPERVAGVNTSASFFSVVGVSPTLGRTYTEEEDRPGANHVVVISHSLWQTRFGGDPDVCGKTMLLDGVPYNILGVMPRGFQFPRAADLPSFYQLPPRTEVWTPAGFTEGQIANRGSHTKSVIAKLKPGVTFGQAQAEIDAIAGRNAQQFADSQGWGARLVPLKEQLVGDLRVALLALMGAAGCVLLIASANVANLLLTRAATREREIAIRVAMGASRMRIVRQLLTESVLLAFAGGSLGVLLAVWGVDLLLAVSPASIPRKHEIAVDGAALAFTLGTTFVTGILFGLAPAFRLSRNRLNETLKEGVRGSTSGRSRILGVLVVTEVALSLILLICSGLLARSFARVLGTESGFNTRNVAAMTLSVSSFRYDFNSRQVRFFENVIENVRAIPGTVSVGAVSELPLSGSDELDVFTIEGRPAPTTPSDEPIADFRFVDEDYFKTMQIELIAGRAFSKFDSRESQRVAIINESLARSCFNGEDPIGKRVKAGSYDSQQPWATVVGLVKDVKHSGLDKESHPGLYFPYRQIVWGHLVIVARSEGDAASLFGPMREAVWSVDKDQPVTSLRTLDDYLSESVSQRRFIVILFAAFAAVALVLSAVGVYGVISYSVSQRTHEIGIRAALGASRSDVFKLVVGRGMLPALTGVIVGLAASFAATRLVQTLLYRVSATDSLTFGAVALLLTAVALIACYVPARRAMKVDPMTALRYE